MCLHESKSTSLPFGDCEIKRLLQVSCDPEGAFFSDRKRRESISVPAVRPALFEDSSSDSAGTLRLLGHSIREAGFAFS